MLEYFSYKKFKKYREEKETKEEAKDADSKQAQVEADGSNKDKDKGKGKETDSHSDEQHDSPHKLHHAKTVLKPEDESFLEQLLAKHEEEDGPPPPLPPRIYAFDLDFPSDNEGASSDEAAKDENPKKSIDKAGKTEEKTEKKPNRFSLLFTKHKKQEESLKPDSTVAPVEAEREEKDLSRVLDRLNLSAKNNTVVSYSKESSELLQRFTLVFKDLVNGVPTAYDDLTKLIEDRDGTINKLFDKLPSSLKKLVTQLPEKLTNSLGPEILAAAAESQGLKAAEGGMKGAAKKLFTPSNLTELVTKPGAIVGMLRAIVDVLKTRWPAFMGMNVIWSVALSLLLVVLWYCYKRGREERLTREKSEAEADSQRIEELPDDLSLPAPEHNTITTPAITTSEPAPASDLPHPPAEPAAISEEPK
ncbi:hypothetical protein PT974_00667 [Cladobotryum mycophilum]|uniref:Ring-like domain-containing protein n=1 Tax=Cladobotryum mycophilum TaxID=491253 RepID=A0ABR0T1J0_9HYPO